MRDFGMDMEAELGILLPVRIASCKALLQHRVFKFQ